MTTEHEPLTEEETPRLEDLGTGWFKLWLGDYEATILPANAQAPPVARLIATIKEHQSMSRALGLSASRLREKLDRRSDQLEETQATIAARDETIRDLEERLDRALHGDPGLRAALARSVAEAGARKKR